MIQVNRSNDIQPSEGEILSGDDAVEAVFSRRAILAPTQKDPPIEIAEHLRTAQFDLDMFGPKPRNEKHLASIEGMLIRNGRLPRMIEGYPVDWRLSGRGLMQVAEEARSHALGANCNVFRRLRDILASASKTLGQTVSMRSISMEEASKRRLIPMSRGNLFNGTRDFRALPERWYELHASLQEARNALRESVRSALSIGRILCAEEIPNSGAVLLHPSQTSKVRFEASNHVYKFLLMSQLPGIGANSDLEYTKKVKKACDWMKGAIAHFDQDGRRPTGDDLQEVAKEKFGITANAAATAWRNLPKEIKRKGGRPTDESRVTSEELRRII